MSKGCTLKFPNQFLLNFYFQIIDDRLNSCISGEPLIVSKTRNINVPLAPIWGGVISRVGSICALHLHQAQLATLIESRTIELMRNDESSPVNTESKRNFYTINFGWKRLSLALLVTSIAIDRDQRERDQKNYWKLFRCKFIETLKVKILPAEQNFIMINPTASETLTASIQFCNFSFMPKSSPYR